MFKKGDIVKVKNRRGVGWNSDGLMDGYCGKIVTLKEVSNSYLGVSIEDDRGHWCWSLEDFEPASNVEISRYIKEKKKFLF
jgi:hypothetical protein